MKISFIVTSRADYSPLSSLINKISSISSYYVNVFVLVNDLNNNFEKKDIFFNQHKNLKYKLFDLGKKKLKITDHITVISQKLSKLFERHKPDLIIILGDRYELLSIPSVSLEKSIPILHIAGGHVTLGAFDDSIRHSLTKFCHLHIASTFENYKNILSLGEQKWRIKLAGSLGAENTKNLKLISSKIILKENGLDSNKDFVLITLHPTTNKNENLEKDMKIFLRSIIKLNFQFVITYPNQDPESEVIIKYFKQFLSKINSKKKRGIFVKNLGKINYLSLMKNCKLMIGNSSSGIIESPSFNIPVLNIGDRQKGRKMHSNILNSSFNELEINKKIKIAINKKFISNISNRNNYYRKNTSLNIIRFIEKVFSERSIKEIITKKSNLLYD